MSNTDVKPDNILFCIGNSPDHIDSQLESTPLETDGDIEVNGVSYPIMRPQPLKHSFRWDDRPNLVELYDLLLIDVGHCTFAPPIFFFA
jgi:serine/threonine-protein kinase SRPK3